MKRWIQMLAIALFTMTVFSACNSEIPIEELPTQAISTENVDLLYDAESLDELEDLSNYIVQGKFRDDAREDLQEQVGIVVFGATVSSFEITKVYKGEMNEGDVIKVAEKYYVDDVNGQETLIHYGNYMPSEVGKEYLMFFDNPPENTERWKDIYSPMCREKGRYPVIAANARASIDVDGMTNEELNLDKGDSTLYRTIYKDVISNYMQ